MPVYLVSNIVVQDHEAYAKYMRAGRASVAKYGGRLLTAGSPEYLEGKWQPTRVTVVEFPSREAALQFYQSSEYQDARALRQGIADYSLVLLSNITDQTR
jgi:uncharacterized protein (DUF1330 family)